jgi:dinuclear metal center YbgI/SA1388 family protein
VVEREELEIWLNDFLRIFDIADFIPNGLQIEGRRDIERIVTAVSINLEVIDAAVREDAGAIVVHHGLFWKNEPATVKGYRKRRLSLLLERGINLFNYHLPLDLHPEIGHNRLLLQGIGAEVVEQSGTGREIGLRGVFHEPVSFQLLIERINDLIGADARFFHYGSDEIRSIYVVSGAGRNELEEVIGMDVDAYLTGDAKESTGYIAREAGLNYIYAGHYNTEKIGVEELGRVIESRFDVQVRFVDVVNPL